MNNEPQSNLTLEQMQQLWQQCNERLTRIATLQETTVRRALERSLSSTHRRMLRDKQAQLLVGAVVPLFFAMQYRLYLGDWRYLLPYLVFFLLWAWLLVAEYRLYRLVRALDPLQHTPMEVAQASERLLRAEKVNMIGSICSIPLLIVDFAPLCARLRGLDIYAYTADHPLFQALLFLGTAALSTALAVWYYRRYRSLLHHLKQDLGQYGDLQ